MKLEDLDKKYKKEYGKTEDKMAKWESAYVKLYNHNHKMLLNFLISSPLFKKNKEKVEIFDDSHQMWFFLDILTMNIYTSKEKQDAIKKAISIGLIKDGKISKDPTAAEVFNSIIGINKADINKTIEITLPNGEIQTIKQVSDVIDTPPMYKHILTTPQRYGACHNLSQMISYHLPQNNNVVTGFMKLRDSYHKLFHSWVETKIDGKDYVLDGTKNIVVDKDFYYNIIHPEILTKMPQKTIIEDYNKYGDDEIFQLYMRLYYLYRNEFLEAMDEIVELEEMDNPIIKA